MEQVEITKKEYKAALEQGMTDFTGRYFSGITISGKGRKMDFSGSRFMDCKFTGDLSSSNFEGAVLNAEFEDCQLKGCDFTKVCMYEGRIKNCDLSGAKFTQASIRRMRIFESELGDVSFMLAQIDNVGFQNISLQSPVKYLDTANITMSGSTEAECDIYEEQVYRQLQVTSNDELEEIIKGIEQSTEKIKGHTEQIRNSNQAIQEAMPYKADQMELHDTQEHEFLPDQGTIIKNEGYASMAEERYKEQNEEYHPEEMFGKPEQRPKKVLSL